MECIVKCLRKLLNFIEDDDDKLCTICYVNNKNTAFFRCGHKCVCSDCANKIMSLDKCFKKCPICRRDIVGKLKIYD